MRLFHPREETFALAGIPFLVISLEQYGLVVIGPFNIRMGEGSKGKRTNQLIYRECQVLCVFSWGDEDKSLFAAARVPMTKERSYSIQLELRRPVSLLGVWHEECGQGVTHRSMGDPKAAEFLQQPTFKRWDNSQKRHPWSSLAERRLGRPESLLSPTVVASYLTLRLGPCESYCFQRVS